MPDALKGQLVESTDPENRGRGRRRRKRVKKFHGTSSEDSQDSQEDDQFPATSTKVPPRKLNSGSRPETV